MTTYEPRQIILLEGRLCPIQRIWHEVDKGVWRVTYWPDDSSALRGCLAARQGQRMVELSVHDLELIRGERKKFLQRS